MTLGHACPLLVLETRIPRGGACFSSKGRDEDAVWKGRYKGADMGVWGNVDVSGEVQQ